MRLRHTNREKERFRSLFAQKFQGVLDVASFVDIPTNRVCGNSVTMSDLADLSRHIALFAKVIGKPNGIFDLSAWSAATQKRRPRRIANGTLTVRAIETNAAFDEPVEIRRFNERMPIAAKIAVQVVGDDEDDVEFAVRLIGECTPSSM